MNIQVEKTVNRILRNVNKNKTEKFIHFENEILIINYGENEIWGTLFYFIFLILCPIILVIYQILKDKDLLVTGLLILSILILSRTLYKIIKGGTRFTIDFNAELITAENKHKLFKLILKNKNLKFIEVFKIELKNKSIAHKHGRSSKWQQLVVENEIGNIVLFTDFESKYPNDHLAYDVKNIIETIRKEYKKNKSIS
ncbi:hypothetical protein HNQ02_001792 [Flavobacterium sp. 7E]|nr:MULTISPECIES: hypothetical protein [unclassified Flavobacterium]NRS88874.1 hypothetical protein [Flavobacterium sp. 7E]NRT15832.1 hypothetical protein [Flavobacterium sp. 28A]